VSRYALVTTDGVVANLYAGQHPGSIPVPEGLPVGPGWSYADGAWAPPGMDLDAALAEVDAHVDALLRQGVSVPGEGAALVRLSLETADRLDWLGLRSMAPSLLALAGGAIPIVGADGGVLVLRSTEQVTAIADALAAYRLIIQGQASHVRALLHAAPDGTARRAIVEQFTAAAPPVVLP
jgi:hypothetical protein